MPTVRNRFLVAALASLLVATATAVAQKIDPDLHGVWRLNVAKSDFSWRRRP
jgi:hypothetical protein